MRDEEIRQIKDKYFKGVIAMALWALFAIIMLRIIMA
jgi:hypothetical protein